MTQPKKSSTGLTLSSFTMGLLRERAFYPFMPLPDESILFRVSSLGVAWWLSG